MKLWLTRYGNRDRYIVAAKKPAKWIQEHEDASYDTFGYDENCRTWAIFRDLDTDVFYCTRQEAWKMLEKADELGLTASDIW